MSLLQLLQRRAQPFCPGRLQAACPSVASPRGWAGRAELVYTGRKDLTAFVHGQAPDLSGGPRCGSVSDSPSLPGSGEGPVRL